MIRGKYNKGGFISEGISNLVPSSKKCAKSLFMFLKAVISHISLQEKKNTKIIHEAIFKLGLLVFLTWYTST